VVDIIATRHAKSQLTSRMKHKNFTEIFPKYNVKVYGDLYDNRKFYFNLSNDESDGFVVLKQVGWSKFIILTITDNGKIDNRDSKMLRFVKVVE